MKKKALVVLLLVVMLVGTFATFSYGADKKTGLYKEDGQWKYFENGMFKAATGLVQRPDNKTWHYVENGIYKKATGLVQCVQPGSSKGKWYYVVKGDLDKYETGLVKCIQPGKSYGKWYYIEKGKQKSYTGLVECVQPGSSYGKTYYVVDGKLNKVSGIVKIKKTYYLAKNGRIEVGYTGSYSTSDYNFYIENGKCVEQIPRKNSSGSLGPKRVVNRNTMKYHKAECKWAKEISSENRWDVCAHNSSIETAGYVPCKVCKP